MSRDLNTVQLIGRLAQDPTAKHTPQGALIVQFTVATGRTFKDAQGNQREETEWTKIACWTKLAELAQSYLRKGARVYIEGRLQTRSWDDAQTGQKQYWTEVIANDIIFLDRRQEVSEDGPELDEELANPPFPGRPAALPAAQPAEPRRFAPGITPRQRPQSVSPPATQDEGDDELPF
jgi:single-strand DNA-binding protein